MEKKNRTISPALWTCVALFALYVLLVLVDGGLSLMLYWKMSSAVAIGLTILLWGIPLLAAGVFAHLGKTRFTIALVVLGSVFTVFSGYRLGSLLYMPYIGTHLLICCVAACMAVVALCQKRSGESAKALQRVLLWLGIISIVISITFSMRIYKASRGMMWIGFEAWHRAFASKRLLESLPAIFGVNGLVSGRSCAALWPLSGSLSILLLWRVVSMAPVQEAKDTDEFPELAAYKAQRPGIDRVQTTAGSYPYLDAYKATH